MPKFSIFDDSRNINNDSWVVSYVTAKNHSVLIIEGYDNYRYFTTMFDFLPVERVNTDFFAVKFSNDPVPGNIRIEPLNDNISHEDLMNVLRKRWNAQENNLDIYITSRLKPSIRVRDLIAAIEAEKENPPLYQTSGNKRINAKYHNCVTWVLEKLTLVDFKISSSSSCAGITDICVGTSPKNYLGH